MHKSLLNSPILLLIFLAAMAICADNTAALDNQAALSAQDRLQLGERMYREGRLPSGNAMQAYIKGDIPVDSTSFSCSSCHLRSGLGSIEGGVTTPPTTGSKLFQPAYVGTILTSSARSARNKYVVNPANRPAYTKETLAGVLRGGMNPAGRVLNDAMPRYHLQDADMAILIDYLTTLSAEFSPGVDATTLRLATIITPDVSPENRKAMLEPLDNFIAAKNSQAKVYAARAKYMGGGGFPEELTLAYRKLSLARWELHGQPETWRKQLEELNQREPVFAFIGGITTGEWQPVHAFCEEHKIPCLFPFTDFPVISETDWYTLYFSKGLYQEGQAAARFLGGMEKLAKEQGILQLVRSSRESRALATGFTEAWQELGNKPPLTVVLPENEPLSSNLLQQLAATHKPAVILLWTGAEIFPALETMATDRSTPEIIFASSGYLQKELWKLPENSRKITYITYPYRLPQETPPNNSNPPPAVADTAKGYNTQRIATRAQAITEVLQLGLMHMNRNYHRDNFLDVISMLPDQTPQDYERLSFGPGQRYASKGCHIVQLTAGTEPILVNKSGWVIH